MKFETNDSKAELESLINNMNEAQIMNIMSVLRIYVTNKMLSEISNRMSNIETTSPAFELQMKGVVDFIEFLNGYLKK